MEGIARYASTWTALFHMSVAMRWSPSMPSSSRSALASWVARVPISAKVRRCGSASPVQVVTCDFPWIVIPWCRMRVTVSGTSCMVLSTASSRWALRGSRVALILRTYHAVCHYSREKFLSGERAPANRERSGGARSAQPTGVSSGLQRTGVSSGLQRTGVSSGSSRSLPRARETALFTVPTDTPSTSAVWASLRSS